METDSHLIFPIHGAPTSCRLFLFLKSLWMACSTGGLFILVDWDEPQPWNQVTPFGKRQVERDGYPP